MVLLTIWQLNRPQVLRSVHCLHTASKLFDLPQLLLAAVYLSSGVASTSVASGAAFLQLAVSGASFVLTMLWLCLQLADSRGKPSMEGRLIHT